MTVADQQVPAVAWNEPDGLMPRGTVVVIPGRGEVPAVYERFGRRLAADAYRVRAVADPSVDAGLARAQISGFLADSSLPAPRVLAGSDTGALFAITLAGSGPGAGVDALVLAGTTSSTTRPTGRWPRPSCCSWSGSGRRLARARLRSGSG
jgi:alpha-beta hydrolase superfamily lysophospholipase